MPDDRFTEAIPLLGRLAAGPDRAAWETLAQLVGPHVRACAAAVAPTHADDAAQEVLVRLPDLVLRFRHRSNAGTHEAQWRRWLGRIAVNAALNLRAADQRRGQREQATVVRAPEFDHALRLALADALAEIPENDRKAVVLRHVLGADDTELAQGLNCSPGAARVRLHRAVARLRKRLAPAVAVVVLPGLLDSLHADESPAPVPFLPDHTPCIPTHCLTGELSPMSRISLIAAALVVVTLTCAATRPGWTRYRTAETHTPAPTVPTVAGQAAQPRVTAGQWDVAEPPGQRSATAMGDDHQAKFRGILVGHFTGTLTLSQAPFASEGGHLTDEFSDPQPIGDAYQCSWPDTLGEPHSEYPKSNTAVMILPTTVMEALQQARNLPAFCVRTFHANGVWTAIMIPQIHFDPDKHLLYRIQEKQLLSDQTVKSTYHIDQLTAVGPVRSVN